MANTFCATTQRPSIFTYNRNPTGSSAGLAAETTADGRFTVLLPHSERVFRRCR